MNYYNEYDRRASGCAGHTEQPEQDSGVADSARGQREQFSGLANGEQQGLERRVRWGEDTGRQNQHRHAGCCSSTHWADSYWHHCRDGKSRRVPSEPGIFPLAHGVPGRVGLLRGAGNAIVPQCAAAFIEACMT